MPSASDEAVHDLADFGPLLDRMAQMGFGFVVIGGCAVGAYGHLRGEEVLTSDLDLYTDRKTLNEILEWAAANDIRVLKKPRPRSIPVAVLAWQEKEINILTDSVGLPEPTQAIRSARSFALARSGDVEVPVADPFDVLRNKVLLNREKDRPHVEVLRRFIEEEAVEAFRTEETARARILPSRQYLDAVRSKTLPRHLCARLIELARKPVDFRFLSSVVPDEDQARELIEKAGPELHQELALIVRSRQFGARRVQGSPKSVPTPAPLLRTRAKGRKTVRAKKPRSRR